MPFVNEKDRVVYSPTKDHVMLNMNRLTVGGNWTNFPMTYYEAQDDNPDHLKAFSFRLGKDEKAKGAAGIDPYNGAMSVITLNYPGTYILRASVMREDTGESRFSTVFVATVPNTTLPTTAAHVLAGEIAKQTHILKPLETNLLSVVYEVPPNEAGTAIQVFCRQDQSSSDTFIIRGYNYDTSGYDPGSFSGSFVGLT